MRRYFLFAIVVIVIGALWVSWQQAGAVARGRARLQVMRERQRNAEAEIRAVEERMAAVTRDVVASASSSQLSDATAGWGAVGSTARPKVPSNPNQRRDDTILSEHRWQNFYLSVRRRDLATAYGPFCRKAGLSPDETKRFMELVVEREAAGIDLLVTLRAEGLPQNDPAFAKLRQDALEKMKAGQLELLGATNFQELQQYERSQPMRTFVSDFAGAASLAGIPIGFAQAEAMTEALANGNERFRGGGNISNAPLDWGSVDEQVRQVLSASQFSMFREFQTTRGLSRDSDRLKALLNQAIMSDVGRGKK